MANSYICENCGVTVFYPRGDSPPDNLLCPVCEKKEKRKVEKAAQGYTSKIGITVDDENRKFFKRKGLEGKKDGSVEN